jgi:hypothetical protein
MHDSGNPLVNECLLNLLESDRYFRYVRLIIVPGLREYGAAQSAVVHPSPSLSIGNYMAITWQLHTRYAEGRQQLRACFC